MTNRERIVNTLNFKPVDRLPVIEIMPWWDKTITRWEAEGLVKTKYPHHDIGAYWGLDDHRQFWIISRDLELREFVMPDTKGFIKTEEDYERILPYLYPEDAVMGNWIEDELHAVKSAHDAGDIAVWFTLDGYFWWPRMLFGIELHLYSFYEEPELYQRICKDLLGYHLRVIEEICSVIKPDFMTIAEDMSYNNGPMISRKMFDTFIRPHYEVLVPALKKHNIKVIVDTDGDCEMLIPWLTDTGVDGILPIECQSGSDVNILREKYPDLVMIGGFNKTVMKNGEAAMRKEFERIAPAMKTGGFIPSVDHQTPPDVSMENYKIYRKLQDEFCVEYHP